jgi:hypothetical protein
MEIEIYELLRETDNLKRVEDSERINALFDEIIDFIRKHCPEQETVECDLWVRNKIHGISGSQSSEMQKVIRFGTKQGLTDSEIKQKMVIALEPSPYY